MWLHPRINSFAIQVDFFNSRQRTQKDGLVVQITVEITALVKAEFYYFADGAHDHKIGESRENIMAEFCIDVLGSIQGDSPDDCTLAHLEFDDAPLEVDFGDIGPEYCISVLTAPERTDRRTNPMHRPCR